MPFLIRHTWLSPSDFRATVKSSGKSGVLAVTFDKPYRRAMVVPKKKCTKYYVTINYDNVIGMDIWPEKSCAKTPLRREYQNSLNSCLNENQLTVLCGYIFDLVDTISPSTRGKLLTFLTVVCSSDYIIWDIIICGFKRWNYTVTGDDLP